MAVTLSFSEAEFRSREEFESAIRHEIEAAVNELWANRVPVGRVGPITIEYEEPRPT